MAANDCTPSAKLASGSVFGKLVVVHEFRAQRRIRVHCICECGNEKTVRRDHLIAGRVTSCGCFNREKARLSHLKHGKTLSATYQSWQHMKGRCLNPNSKFYVYYGGRGIKVCDRWLSSFDNFLNDMGEKPTGMTLDRIDVNGDYEPKNCRWATAKEQSRNRRFNRLITYQNQTKCIGEWAEITGISYDRIRYRLDAGLKAEEIFS